MLPDTECREVGSFQGAAAAGGRRERHAQPWGLGCPLSEQRVGRSERHAQPYKRSGTLITAVHRTLILHSPFHMETRNFL